MLSLLTGMLSGDPGFQGERLIQKAVSGFDKALKRLDQASEKIQQQRQMHAEEVARIQKRDELLQQAHDKSQRVAAKLREIVEA